MGKLLIIKLLWSQFPHLQNGVNNYTYLSLSQGNRNKTKSKQMGTQFSSVAQLCVTFRHPMDCSTPGFPVHHQFLEFAQTHVHWVSDAIQPSHPPSSPSPPAPNLSQHQGLFQWVSSSHQMAKVLKFQLQYQSISPSISSMGTNQTHKLLHSKGNRKQNEKIANKLGEYICNWYYQQGFNFQNIQTTRSTQ